MDAIENGAEKVCSKCERSLDRSAFNNDKTKPDGKESRCRDCRNEYKRVHSANGRVQLARQKKKAQEVVTDPLVSQANVRALKRLVENHQREFLQLARVERDRLGVPSEKKWMAVS